MTFYDKIAKNVFASLEATNDHNGEDVKNLIWTIRDGEWFDAGTFLVSIDSNPRDGVLSVFKKALDEESFNEVLAGIDYGWKFV